ncbi:MAG: NERD domain-containing protein [Saccharospirillaceae bacterium]|nr:NERD domain-containing protein [Pseudomonadales bacterium]NRB77485.1 NERD domain-containing protein [Saccharospirillaceae bacterium]
MICKDKTINDTRSARLKPANEYEKSVEFFLQQEFKSQSDILVFNDLMLNFDDNKCQIDHLIVYRYGFILIESTTITGEVRVNSLDEWLRNNNRQWSAIASPVKQIKLQQTILKELLAANASSILGKLIFDNLQLSFAKHSWDQLYSITHNTIIDRDGATETVKSKMVKVDFIVDRCKKIMSLPISILDSDSKFLDSRISFKASELENLRKFLIEVDLECRKMDKKSNSEKEKTLIKTATTSLTLKVIPKQQVESKSTVQKKPVKKEKIEDPKTTETTKTEKSEVKVDLDNIIVCKKCKKTDSLEGKWGKYGYYVFCSDCKCNTSMKINCPSCDSKNVKNRKEKNNYYVVCLDCKKEALVMS